MSDYHISGIQQVGVGNIDTPTTYKWYRDHLGMDLKMFDEAAEAGLMLPYTGGQPQKRHAILALNHMGGGGVEIWQYTKRTPLAPKFDFKVSDLGITRAVFKCKDIELAHTMLKSRKTSLTSEILIGPDGINCFSLKDLHGNWLSIKESEHFFKEKLHPTGGIYGATLGVRDMDKSMSFYQDLLKYDQVIYDGEGIYEDLKMYPGGSLKHRRVILGHSKPRKGPFAPLLGNTQIELLQNLEETPKQIYKDRYWGDLGYIHLCFDIVGMDLLRATCKELGHPFTVDSGDFDMGEAAGQFAYIEDPDGTLIEFVETQKIPILKKIGWYLDLRKRKRDKHLPNYLLKAMGFMRDK